MVYYVSGLYVLTINQEPKLAHSIYSPQDFYNNLSDIRKQFKENGIIFLREISSNSAAIDIANLLGLIVENLDADNYGITEISNTKRGHNKKNSAAYTSQELHLHTDRSPIAKPPTFVMNWICVKDCVGGESTLADGNKIFEYINTEHPEYVDALTNTDVACFSDGIDTFIGSIFTFNEQNNLETRFRYDKCSFFKLESSKEIKFFKDSANKLAYVIDFDVGEGYILNNKRWLHGRKSFKGYRMIRRIHIKETI
jgi:hypothetical protein